MLLVVFTSESRVFLRYLKATDVKTSLGGETSAEATRDERKRRNGGRKDHLALPLSPPAVAAAGSRLPSLRLPLPHPHLLPFLSRTGPIALGKAIRRSVSEGAAMG